MLFILLITALTNLLCLAKSLNLPAVPILSQSANSSQILINETHLAALSEWPPPPCTFAISTTSIFATITAYGRAAPSSDTRRIVNALERIARIVMQGGYPGSAVREFREAVNGVEFYLKWDSVGVTRRDLEKIVITLRSGLIDHGLRGIAHAILRYQRGGVEGWFYLTLT